MSSGDTKWKGAAEPDYFLAPSFESDDFVGFGAFGGNTGVGQARK